jgi:hypothetical protein
MVREVPGEGDVELVGGHVGDDHDKPVAPLDIRQTAVGRQPLDFQIGNLVERLPRSG